MHLNKNKNTFYNFYKNRCGKYPSNNITIILAQTCALPVIMTVERKNKWNILCYLFSSMNPLNKKQYRISRDWCKLLFFIVVPAKGYRKLSTVSDKRSPICRISYDIVMELTWLETTPEKAIFCDPPKLFTMRYGGPHYNKSSWTGKICGNNGRYRSHGSPHWTYGVYQPHTRFPCTHFAIPRIMTNNRSNKKRLTTDRRYFFPDLEYSLFM
jgi:hypothetical protein